MKLYDNDVYREKFMEIVYGVLSSDETNDRANQIIDAFDNAPQVETEDLLANDPLTMEQLREMDGEPVFIKCLFNDELSSYVVVDKRRDSAGIFTRLFYASLDYYGDEWLAYRRRPEKQPC